MTGTAPNAVFARRNTGDGASSGVCSVVTGAVSDLDTVSAQCAVTVGVAGSGAGFTIGHEQTARNRYDNARSNSQAYGYGERYAISATLVAQVYTPGTSAASAPDVSALVAGDTFADGTAVFLVTERPMPGDLVEICVDCGLSSITNGMNVGVWVNITDTTGAQTNTYINWGNNTAEGPWPTRVDSERRLMRHFFTLPTAAPAIRNIAVMTMGQGPVGGTGTIKLHGVSIAKA